MKIFLIALMVAHVVGIVYLCWRFERHYRKALRVARELQGA